MLEEYFLKVKFMKANKEVLIGRKKKKQEGNKRAEKTKSLRKRLMEVRLYGEVYMIT